MNGKDPLANLGRPDLTVAGFQLWIHGRQFPDDNDYDDGNWLRVTAHCGMSGSSIWVHGSIVMVTDIAGFGEECDVLLRGDSTTAGLEPCEPELCVTLESTDTHGHILARVLITPDNLLQSHKIDFKIDQSYLPGIIEQCSAILEEYPIRGLMGRKADR